MTKSQFQNIEPRYRKTEPRTPEDRQKIVDEVNAIWERFMPSRRGEDVGGGGLILKSSNGRVNKDGPGMSIAWRRMVEKARKEIAEHKRHIETIEQLEQMAAVESDTESTEVIEATGRDDFAAERSQFERLTKRFVQLMKATQ